MIKPQKSNLDNLIVVLVWFVLYIADTFSPRMHWLRQSTRLLTFPFVWHFLFLLRVKIIVYNKWLIPKKKKKTHHKQDTNTQQLTRTDQTNTRKQPRLLKLNPLEKKERKKTQ